jgi:hypothetical protein
MHFFTQKGMWIYRELTITYISEIGREVLKAETKASRGQAGEEFLYDTL